MKRICFIGNSHVAAIKEGYDALQKTGALGEASITIFGSHGDSIRHCDVKDGVLFANNKDLQNSFRWTSGGHHQIQIADYDEIFVVIGPSFFSTSLFWAGDPASSVYDLPPLSADLSSSIFKSIFDSWYMKLARDIAKEASATRVTHIGVPFKSDAHPQSKRVLRRLAGPDSDTVERIKNVMAQIDQEASKHTYKNFRLGRPPEKVLENHGLFTKHEYCLGSRKLTQSMKEEHVVGDFRHMNARYGEALIGQVLRAEQVSV